jgi:hypothetical protein
MRCGQRRGDLVWLSTVRRRAERAGGAQTMRNRHRRTSSVEGLRLAIDCMPRATREAMLRGVQANGRIIVGAYVDDLGGVCPMLAAHRCGGRTDFLSFAKSWDRFTRAKGRSREATEREVRILVAHLQASLTDEHGLEFDAAIREHHRLRGRSLRGHIRPRGPRIVGVDPTGEIRAYRLTRRGGPLVGDNDASASLPGSVSPVPVPS